MTTGNSNRLLRTPLYDWHVEHHGRMVEFGGWDMPVQYSSIVEEHHAVRQRVGLFDISHMGRLRFEGAGACRFLDRVLTNHVSQLQVGQVRYALVCNDSGGILDDVLVYRLPDCYWLVVNASNRLKIVNWLEQQPADDVQWADLTLTTGMLALQGPETVRALPGTYAAAWSQLKYYSAVDLVAVSNPGLGLISRTGYTGEEGCELIVPTEQVQTTWEHLLAAAGARELNIVPCGLGARDTLRLEAAMPLYGHELSEAIDPITAGLEFAVKFSKPDFIGKAALEDIARQSGRRVRVGLELAGRRIAREGATICTGDTPIGEVTSGTFSPTLERSIAMGYISADFSSPGTAVEVDIRGKRETATVVVLPFYRRPR